MVASHFSSVVEPVEKEWKLVQLMVVGSSSGPEGGGEGGGGKWEHEVCLAMSRNNNALAHYKQSRDYNQISHALSNIHGLYRCSLMSYPYKV